jgi:transcriptional regulator with XRE-family HTH domain
MTKKRGLSPHPIDRRAGRNLRFLRVRAGYSQERLARETKITFQQVQKYECAKNRMSLSRAWQFSEVLGFRIEELFQRTPRKLRSEIEPLLGDPQLLHWMTLFCEARALNNLPAVMKSVLQQVGKSQDKHHTLKARKRTSV